MAELIFTTSVDHVVDSVIENSGAYDKCFVIADSNTSRCAVPIAARSNQRIASAEKFIFEAGEENKTPQTLMAIWDFLMRNGATRHSIVVNIGGGVTTDMGGFAAATFMRGIRFVNVATTLLGAVDASIGGKTGIDFNCHKNMVGAFAEPMAVVISNIFLDTLPLSELKSGYGEMLKHGMLSSADMLAKLIDFDLTTSASDPQWLKLIEANIAVKKKFVEADFHEGGIRKALNLGHTFGHAIEAVLLAKGESTRHGYAVAWGLLADLVLSNLTHRIDSRWIHPLASIVRETYGAFPLGCKANDKLIEAMSHDKKNRTANSLNFTLLREIGQPEINCEVDRDTIVAALDIVRDLTGA